MSPAPLQMLRTVWLVAGVALIAAIWVACLMPHPPSLPGGDKVKHILAYVAVTAWWVAAFPSRAWQLFAGFTVMGAAIELAQGASGYRSFEWLDIAANTSGALTGVFLVLLTPGPARNWLRASSKEGHQ